jgi:hypothetical protein
MALPMATYNCCGLSCSAALKLNPLQTRYQVPDARAFWGMNSAAVGGLKHRCSQFVSIHSVMCQCSPRFFLMILGFMTFRSNIRSPTVSAISRFFRIDRTRGHRTYYCDYYHGDSASFELHRPVAFGFGHYVMIVEQRTWGNYD